MAGPRCQPSHTIGLAILRMPEKKSDSPLPFNYLLIIAVNSLLLKYRSNAAKLYNEQLDVV